VSEPLASCARWYANPASDAASRATRLCRLAFDNSEDYVADSRGVKVLLQDGEYVETLWAQPVGGDRYRLDNSPFWAYGVSWLDVVEARPDETGMLAMTRVVEKSGHRTVRVILRPPCDESAESQRLLDDLVAMGCSYEGMHPGYIAIDIPAEVSLDAVADALTRSGQEWEHADPRYAELYPDEAGEATVTDG